MVRDPGARPSIAELLNHRYVTGVEVAKEEEKKLDPPSAVKMISIKYKVTIGSQQNYREI